MYVQFQKVTGIIKEKEICLPDKEFFNGHKCEGKN